MRFTRLAFEVLLLAAGVSAELGVSFAVNTTTAAPAGEPNPPEWPDNVMVFSPEDQDEMNITDVIENRTECLTNTSCGHFSPDRLAVMFKPGEYNNVSIKVGYYTQVLGLGLRADDVLFTNTTKGIYCPSDPGKPSPGSLDSFWRSAENFATNASEGMLWSVSQAAPIRRVHVMGNLSTDEENSWASGGFLANVLVDGKTSMGGQQQWMSRNSDLGMGYLGTQYQSSNRHVMGVNWNSVFVGCTGAPASRYPFGATEDQGITNEPTTPVIAEKPFITIDASGKYSLQIPPVRWMSVGSDASQFPNETNTVSVPFSEVYVAFACNSTTSNCGAKIQEKLDAGLHVVLSPGIYWLNVTLTLRTEGQVLLGIGMATLHPPLSGGPAVRVAPATADVRVAGLMLGATLPNGTVEGDEDTITTLLEWGVEGRYDDGNRLRPGILSDIFARVGGPEIDRTIGVDRMVRVHSGNVVGDNLWLWRADHAAGPGNQSCPGVDNDDDDDGDRCKGCPDDSACINDGKKNDYHLVANGEYPCEAGLEVIGDHVTMYGLFVEHTLGNMTQWRGEDGTVYFYQSELPYDVNQSYYGNGSYAGYVVDDNVTVHRGHGIGVYTYFRDHTVWVESGIRAPDTDGVRFNNAFSRYLNGYGGINHVLNGFGDSANGTAGYARMGRLASSIDGPGNDAFQAACPVDPIIPAIKRQNTVLIVIIVILVILLLLTAFYAYFLRKSVLIRSTSRSASLADGSPGGASARDADNRASSDGEGIALQASTDGGGR